MLVPNDAWQLYHAAPPHRLTWAPNASDNTTIITAHDSSGSKDVQVGKGGRTQADLDLPPVDQCFATAVVT